MVGKTAGPLTKIKAKVPINIFSAIYSELKGKSGEKEGHFHYETVKVLIFKFSTLSMTF